MSKIVGIYKITSPTNRIYIGQSLDIDSRWNKYYKLQNCNKQIRLYRSFLKHNVVNHIFEIAEECTIEELNERERHWQDFYDVLSYKGLNCVLTTSLNSKRKYTKSTCLKISKSLTGKKLSQDHINSLSKAKIGKKYTKAQVENMAIGNKGKNSNYDEEIIKEIIELLLIPIPSRDIINIYPKISYKIISDIRNNRSWRYLTENVIFPKSNRNFNDEIKNKISIKTKEGMKKKALDREEGAKIFVQCGGKLNYFTRNLFSEDLY